jgi:hypothetical protein
MASDPPLVALMIAPIGTNFKVERAAQAALSIAAPFLA